MPQKIFFKNKKDLKLCGILSNPAKDISRPIVVLCHGFMVNKNTTTNTKLEKILNKENIATFRFDFFGHGESEGKFEDITATQAVEDVHSAVDYLKSLGYEKISLVGSSFGGLAVLIASSERDDIFALVLKSSVSNYKEQYLKSRGKKDLKDWKEKGYQYRLRWDGKKMKLNYSFFKDSISKDGFGAAEKIKIPALIIHGDKDRTVPVEHSKKTASLIKNSKLEIIKGADHKYSKSGDFNKMLDLISGFIIRKLK